MEEEATLFFCFIKGATTDGQEGLWLAGRPLEASDVAKINVHFGERDLRPR